MAIPTFSSAAPTVSSGTAHTKAPSSIHTNADTTGQPFDKAYEQAKSSQAPAHTQHQHAKAHSQNQEALSEDGAPYGMTSLPLDGHDISAHWFVQAGSDKVGVQSMGVPNQFFSVLTEGVNGAVSSTAAGPMPNLHNTQNRPALTPPSLMQVHQSKHSSQLTGPLQGPLTSVNPSEITQTPLQSPGLLPLSAHGMAESMARPSTLDKPLGSLVPDAMVEVDANKDLKSGELNRIVDTAARTGLLNGEVREGLQPDNTLAEGELTPAQVRFQYGAPQSAGQSTATTTNLPEMAAMQASLTEGDSLDNLEAGGEWLNNRSSMAEKSETKSGINSPVMEALTQKISVGAQDPKWGEKVAERISMMMKDGVQEARVQLDPPELGALEIRLRMQNDQVSVTFHANHQQVRDVLESQSPRLKEMLEQHGIDLTDVHVSDQGQQQHQSGQGDGQGYEDGDWLSEEMPDIVSATNLTVDNLVDYFA